MEGPTDYVKALSDIDILPPEDLIIRESSYDLSVQMPEP